MILVEKLKKLADDVAIKNRGIQSKESIKDNELILIFILLPSKNPFQL